MADFFWKPDFSFEEKIEFDTIVSRFENGVEQRRAKRDKGIRSWRLEFKNREKNEFESVRDFFISKKGAYESFTWENPNDGVVYTVRFGEDGIRFVNKAFGIYDFDLTLVEVIL